MGMAMGVMSVMVPTLVPIAVETKQLTTNSTATANFDGMIESMKYATLSALERPTTPTNIPAAKKMSSIVMMFLSPTPRPISVSFSSNDSARIAFPAALASLALILVLTLRTDVTPAEIPPYNLIQIIPYVLVLIGGIIGINVFVVLLIGIVSGAVIALATGATGQTGILAVKALLENMGSGSAGMFETSMVAILVSAICALIREYGGFEALLGWIRKAFRGKRGGQIGMGLLVGAMDIATANNTVAIVMANPIAKEMSEEYGITPRKAASILDTFSCIFQGIIPYGAQMLVAISAAHELGYAISAFDIIPNLFYPYLLAVSSFFFIAIDSKKKA